MTEMTGKQLSGKVANIDPQVLFSEAVLLHQSRNYDEAEGTYLRLLQLLPGHPRVLANLALLYREIRRFDEAVEFCRQALVQAPGDPSLHLNLGAIYEEQGDMTAAIASFRKVLELEPEDFRALNNLGKVLHRQGQAQEGELAIRRALRLAPDYSLALNNLGVICSERGDSNEAADCFRKALRLDPENIGTLYNLAGICNCQGQADVAIPLLRQILVLAPDHAPARHMLAALVGETTEAAPPEYVEMTFDAYAGRFERHLTEKLGYEVPKILRQMIEALLPTGNTITCGLDLGCGTGLAGEALRGLARVLHGVDISAGMLDKAAEKGVYDRLKRQSIESFLMDCQEKYDLVVAADVFVYIDHQTVQGAPDTPQQCQQWQIHRLTLPFIAASTQRDPPRSIALLPGGYPARDDSGSPSRSLQPVSEYTPGIERSGRTSAGGTPALQHSARSKMPAMHRELCNAGGRRISRQDGRYRQRHRQLTNSSSYRFIFFHI